MAYASYDFYQTNFGGTLISAAQWGKLSCQADGIINKNTFNRLHLAQLVPENVLMACCAIADALFIQDTEKLRHFAEIKSENNDGYSLSYESSADIFKRHQLEIQSAIDTYLPRSHPLRYLGV